jgi:hypothetical protein
MNTITLIAPGATVLVLRPRAVERGLWLTGSESLTTRHPNPGYPSDEGGGVSPKWTSGTPRSELSLYRVIWPDARS